MKEAVKREIVKLLYVGVAYPIEDNKWESPRQCVPKKEGVVVVPNEKGEHVPMRHLTVWHVCMDYKKGMHVLIRITFLCHLSTKYLISYEGVHVILFQMVKPGTTRFILHRKIYRKPFLHVSM